MATYEITAPDGRVFEIDAPDGASQEEVLAFAQQNMGQAAAPAPAAPLSPRDEWKKLITEQTNELPAGLKLTLGIGKGMTDVGRGVGQALGLVDREDIKDSRETDAPLMNTFAGQAGNIAGTAAVYTPTMFIPGANTIPGAAAIGALSGLLAPSESTGETLTNTAAGGLLGPLALVAARAVPALTQGAKSLVQPFTKKGQETIAARTLMEFAGGREAAEKAALAARNSQPAVAGVQNTAAEVSGNAGIAQLERALRQNPTLSTAFTERLQGNRSAMLEGLLGIAKDDGAMAAATKARSDLAGPFYDAAKAQNIVPDQAFMNLAQRPAMQSAIARAEKMMAETGGNPQSGEFMHMVKMSLDDMLDTAPQMGIGKAEANAIKATRGDFIDWLETQSRMYAAGRQAYRDGSRPINQMQIGQELVDRFQPALADFGADTRTTAATYAKALRDSDATAARATGIPNARMSDVLDFDQQITAQGVAVELAKRAKADELGRIPGSNTAQNLVSQNLLRQTLGPLGLPQSVAESTLLNSVMRVPQFAASLGEQRVLDRLAQGLLDPQDAARLLDKARLTSGPMRGLLAAEYSAVPLSIGFMQGAQ